MPYNPEQLGISTTTFLWPEGTYKVLVNTRESEVLEGLPALRLALMTPKQSTLHYELLRWFDKERDVEKEAIFRRITHRWFHNLLAEAWATSPVATIERAHALKVIIDSLGENPDQVAGAFWDIIAGMEGIDFYVRIYHTQLKSGKTIANSVPIRYENSIY